MIWIKLTLLRPALVNLSNLIFRRFVRRFVPFLTGMEAGNYGLTNGRTDFIKFGLSRMMGYIVSSTSWNPGTWVKTNQRTTSYLSNLLPFLKRV